MLKIKFPNFLAKKSIHWSKIMFLSGLIVSAINTVVFLEPASANVKAEEKTSFKFTVPPGDSLFFLRYKVTIEDATPPEQLIGLEVKATASCPDNLNLEGDETITGLSDPFSRDVTVALPEFKDISERFECTLTITSTATEKFKNKIRKKDAVFLRNGVVQFKPNLGGFEFKSESDGIYTLFNDSDEDWEVNKLLIRINKDEVDLDSFDLNNPNSLLWDFNLSPFILSQGDSFNLDLGEELLIGGNFFSQAFVDIKGITTERIVLDIQQHQHETIPEPTSTLSFLALGTLGAASTKERKLKSPKNHNKE